MNVIKGKFGWTTDAPAVRGALDPKVEECDTRYISLGVQEEMMQLARRDAADSIKALKTFLEIHHLPAIQSEDHLLAYYSELWYSQLFIPWMKWATAVPLADLSGLIGTEPLAFRELPKTPAGLGQDVRWWSVVCPGQRNLIRALRTRLGERNDVGGATRRALRLSWSLLGIKGMMPSMWVEGLIPNLKDHASALGRKPAPLDDDAIESLRVAAATVREMYARTGLVEMDCGMLKYTDLPKARLSSKAGYVQFFDEELKRFRSGLGTRAAVFQEKHPLSRALGGMLEPEDRDLDLLHMSYHPQRGVSEFRGHPYDFEWQSYSYSTHVDVVALQEPFKVRTISVSDGPTTAAGTPIQKLWHTAMRDMEIFELIGGVDVPRSTSRFVEFLRLLKPGHYQGVVSGDYSAATDGLSIHATRDRKSVV